MYIDLQYHYIRKLVKDSTIQIFYYSTLEIATNILIKLLTILLFFQRVKLLKLYDSKIYHWKENT